MNLSVVFLPVESPLHFPLVDVFPLRPGRRRWVTSGHLVTGGRGLPPCRPPVSAFLHLRPLTSLEAFRGRDPGPALVYGQLHLVHQAQPDLQLQHDDVVHEDGVDEEDDPGAAVEDDEDVAELLGAFLDEKSFGPGEAQEEGEEDPGLQLAHHVLHPRDVPGHPGPVGSLVHCSVEIISEELIVMLRQLSYAIKNQLKAPKAPY